MRSPVCLICGNSKLINLSEFESKSFVDYWSKYYKIDVSRFFATDKFFLKKCPECSLEFFGPSIPADTKIYDELQEAEWYYESEKDEFRYALGKITEFKNIGSVLDVGCGEGLFLKKLLSSYSVAGMEISEKSIEKLKKSGIETNVGDRKFDFVSAFQVLEHVNDPKSFIENILSKLNDGGFLLITVPNPESNFIKETTAYLDFPPHHITRWSKAVFEFLAVRYRLKILDYYLEPIRIEHYNAIVNERRKKSIQGKLSGNFLVSKLFSFFDKMIMPYAIDHVKYPVHSHGVLFRKLDRA